jgi:hypothetical protein
MARSEAEDRLFKALESTDVLSVTEVMDIIWALKNDCVTYREDRYEAGFYAGEMNAFYICLDLLEKTKESAK